MRRKVESYFTKKRRVLACGTPSQRWASGIGACFSGRMRLDRQSIAEYFRTTTHVRDMLWIAHQLKPSMGFVDNVSYYYAVERAESYGRWAAKHTRERLIEVFQRYGVTIPAELL